MSPSDKILVSVVPSASTILQRRQAKQHAITTISINSKIDSQKNVIAVVSVGRKVEDTNEWGTSTSTKGSASPFNTLRKTTTKMRTRFQLPTFLIFLLFTFILLGTVSAAPVSEDKETVSTTSKATSTTKEPSSPTTTKDPKKSTTATDDEDEDDYVPKNIYPFDTNIGANFTEDSCPEFFQTVLDSKTYKECMPLSPLIQNSRSFLQAQRIGGKAISNILDSTCNVDLPKCTAYMESLGRDIRLPGACEQDFEQRNPIVVQAYAAFIAYEPIYKAGCLKSDKGNYCYLDALDGDTSGTDTLLYWLPLGKNIPQTLKKSPSCNECISGTMDIFRQYAGNASQPLHDTYPKAAAQINLGCGDEYLNATAVPLLSSATTSYLPPSMLFTALFLFAAVLLA